MRRILVVLLIPILLVSGLYAVFPTLPHANAAGVGEVCIAKGGANSCPLTPPLINSTLPPAPQLQIAVVINSSLSLNAFDITLLTNSSFLKPAGYSLTGAVLAWTSTPVHCIGNVGAGCATTDNKNTLHIAAAAQGLSLPPTTGLLFTAIYNITGATFSTPIGFQVGCATTSVQGGVCITIANGSSQDDPETIQNAKFTDLQYFDFQPEFGVASLTDPVGSVDSSLILNATSVNGYSGTVTLAVTVVPSQPSITVAFSRNPLKVNTTVTPDSSTVTVTVSASTTPGNYTLSFTATGTGSPVPPPNSLNIPLIVPPPDYSISANPGTLATPLNMNVSTPGISQITLTSLNNFAGRVNLTVHAPTGLTGTLQTSSLVVPRNGIISTTLMVNSTTAGTYALNITGVTTGLSPRSINVQINVFDFSMTTTSDILVMPQRSSLTKTITFSSVKNLPYAVNITLSNISVENATLDGHFVASTGVTVSCFPLLVNITVTGTTPTPANTQCRIFGNLPGNYTVTVVGTSGKLSRIITFPAMVTGPDFAITPTPSIQTVDQGKTSTVSLFIAAQNGLVSNLTGFSYTVTGGSSPQPTATFNVQSIPLTLAKPNGTVVMTITAGLTTPIGPYTLLITALASATSQKHTIALIVVVTTTASPHDLAVSYVTPSVTTTTIGSKIDITIEVSNLGKVSETSTVLALAGSITVGRVNVTLTSGQSMNVTMTWDTTGYSSGAYIISGQILAVQGESNTANNLRTYATPVTLNSANSSVLSSPYVEPSIIAALVVIVAIVAILLLQSRRKIPTK